MLEWLHTVQSILLVNFFTETLCIKLKSFGTISGQGDGMIWTAIFVACSLPPHFLTLRSSTSVTPPHPLPSPLLSDNTYLVSKVVQYFPPPVVYPDSQSAVSSWRSVTYTNVLCGWVFLIWFFEIYRVPFCVPSLFVLVSLKNPHYLNLYKRTQTFLNF